MLCWETKRGAQRACRALRSLAPGPDRTLRAGTPKGRSPKPQEAAGKVVMALKDNEKGRMGPRGSTEVGVDEERGAVGTRAQQQLNGP